MSNKKLTVAILYGGKNTEHEISLISAKNVLSQLDPELFNHLLIAISPTGQWYYQETTKAISDHCLPVNYSAERLIQITLNMSSQPFSTQQGLLPAIDVVFPVLHGIHGEDGTIQGLLRCLNLPFVGCDVLASAICMDKIAMKQCLSQAKLPIAPWIALQPGELESVHIENIVQQLGLPLFVKPANAGSSVGVIKINRADELANALKEASHYDEKILIESMIKGREIESSVLGNQNPIISLPGEITINKKYAFYSYEAKYCDKDGAVLTYPAQLTEKQIETIQTHSLAAYRALHCEGMARVDGFLTEDDEFYISELNTIPGFTPISMYPKLWEITGKSQIQLMTELIQLARERFDRQQSLCLAREVD